MELKVLYEDNHLIAVFKPSGLLVQSDMTRDKCLMDYVKDYLRVKYIKQGNVYLGLLHRLDRPVSGIVLFAKTSKGASRLSEQIRNRLIQKRYTVLLDKAPKEPVQTLRHFMIKNAAKNKSWAYSEFRSDAKEAILDYKVVEIRDNGKCLVTVDLKTGRHHQIRAQFAAIGCPIVGDGKYGSRYICRSGGICLCATSLTFKTATTDELVELNVEPAFDL